MPGERHRKAAADIVELIINYGSAVRVPCGEDRSRDVVRPCVLEWRAHDRVRHYADAACNHGLATAEPGAPPTEARPRGSIESPLSHDTTHLAKLICQTDQH